MLKYVLLGLLAAEPRYGYELKTVFEEVLGGTWPLNIGQVYTTLTRLEREGLVECQVVPQDLLPDRKVYSLTSRGRTSLARWTNEATEGPVRLRDELFLKVLVASLADPKAAVTLLRRQRQHHLRSLAELTRLLEEPTGHPSTVLLLEGAALRLEAELRWLDLCEERLKDGGP
jgi:DNA-binding PadR family transcriptional regulator